MVVEWLKRLQRDNYFEALKEYIENLRMFYIHHFSIFDYDNASNNITLSEVHNSLQDTKKMLSQVEQSLDKQNKTLSEFRTAILENQIKLRNETIIITSPNTYWKKYNNYTLKIC